MSEQKFVKELYALLHRNNHTAQKLEWDLEVPSQTQLSRIRQSKYQKEEFQDSSHRMDAHFAQIWNFPWFAVIIYEGNEPFENLAFEILHFIAISCEK